MKYMADPLGDNYFVIKTITTSSRLMRFNPIFVFLTILQPTNLYSCSLHLIRYQIVHNG